MKPPEIGRTESTAHYTTRGRSLAWAHCERSVFSRYGVFSYSLDWRLRRGGGQPMKRTSIEKGCAGEEDRVPVVRALDAVAPVAGAHGGGCAAPVDRAGRGRRGAGRRRRLLPRAPLRAAARLAVSAPRRRRRAHLQDRD